MVFSKYSNILACKKTEFKPFFLALKKVFNRMLLCARKVAGFVINWWWKHGLSSYEYANKKKKRYFDFVSFNPIGESVECKELFGSFAFLYEWIGNVDKMRGSQISRKETLIFILVYFFFLLKWIIIITIIIISIYLCVVYVSSIHKMYVKSEFTYDCVQCLCNMSFSQFYF